MVNSTHMRLRWVLNNEVGDPRACAATHGQIATVAVETVSEAAGGGDELGSLEVVRGAIKLDAEACGNSGGGACVFSETVQRPAASGKAFVWKYRRKNVFGWSAWSKIARVPAAAKAASVISAPAPAPAAPALAPSAPASAKKAGGDCVDATKLSGAYTCAQYAERKLCKMSFVAKNCRASCGLCGGSRGGGGGGGGGGAVAATRSEPPVSNNQKKKEKAAPPAPPSRPAPPARRVEPPPQPQVRSKSESTPPIPGQRAPARTRVLLGDTAVAAGKESDRVGRLRLVGGAEPLHNVCLGEQCGEGRPLIVLGSATLPKLTLLSGGDPE